MEITVRPLREADLSAADRICRVAFGTFLGLPNPASFMGDADYVRTRWLADPTAAFAALVDGEIVGSNLATEWGSIGFFGPLSVRPDLWGRGIGQRLVTPVLDRFETRGVEHAALFTFPQSVQHVGLYQRFGFWPRYLTAVLAKPVVAPAPATLFWTGYSEVPSGERGGCLAACRALTGALYAGLDVEREIRAADAQGLGDTLLLAREHRLVALGVCHVGPRTEAGSDACFVKFAGVEPGPRAGDDFERLLDACEAFAAARGVRRLVAGISTACHDAYRRLLARGFRSEMHGIAMHRPNRPAYLRPDVYALGDWR